MTAAIVHHSGGEPVGRQGGGGESSLGCRGKGRGEKERKGESLK